MGALPEKQQNNIDLITIALCEIDSLTKFIQTSVFKCLEVILSDTESCTTFQTNFPRISDVLLSD